MVDSNGASGGCPCSCQSDLTPSEFESDQSESGTTCCTPQAFTSVLLGILACVLVTGGVFLAFHRWDPMWLLVSGVGVILIFIGTVLHCTSSSQREHRRHSSSGASKGCRHLPPDHHHNHHHHQLANNGSLTEQLLPLSNARSVSQLSLNMLPGYFPPVVSAYGIEQHSAVVQNINRLVQQQQQQQQQQQLQQQQATPGSGSPGVVSNNAGKSFILLSLPADANPANIQNLIATVYQLDGNVSSEIQATDVTSQMASPTISCMAVPPTTTPPPVLKNAEVQTCKLWPPAEPISSCHATGNAITTTTASTSTDNCQSERIHRTLTDSAVVTTACCDTQTEEAIPVNLMDCGSDLPSVCDNIQSGRGCSSASDNALVDIHGMPSDLLVEVFESSTRVLIDVPESNDLPESRRSPSSALKNAPETSSILYDVPGPSSNILVDIPSSSSMLVDVPELSSNVLVDVPVTSSNVFVDTKGSSSNALVDVPGTSSNALVGEPGSFSNDFVGVTRRPSDKVVGDARSSSNVLVDIPGPTSGLVDNSRQSTSVVGDSRQSTSIVDNSGQSTSVIPNTHAQCNPSSSSERLVNLLDSPHVISTETEPNRSSLTNQESGATESRENSASEFPPDSVLVHGEGINSEFSSSISNLSAIDAEVDDEDSVGRSSPPPSYEDVTNESEPAVGAFGLAYGTI